MQGRNTCFPKVDALIACLELINPSLRMTFLEMHFGPGDLPALLGADPKPSHVKGDYFIQILTKLSAHEQRTWIWQELGWIGERYSTTSGLVLLLKNFSPETWPIIVIAVSPTLLSKNAFELVVVSRHFETAQELANAHSISHLFPEITTFEALRANLEALLNVNICHILSMLVKHRSLVQSYDDYKALIKLGEDDQAYFLVALGKEWWKKELNTLDRVCAELDKLTRDEGAEWFKEIVVPHVKTANSFVRLHDSFTVRNYGDLYHARIKCLIDAVLPHVGLPSDVQSVLAAFDVTEINNRKYFTEKFCEIFVKCNPSFNAVIEHLQLFKNFGDTVRVPKGYVDHAAFLVRHHDFHATIFRTFFRGIMNYLPMVIKKEEDLSHIIQAIPYFNGYKKEFWAVMEAHLPVIISDPKRLSAFRETHGLKNDAQGWLSFFRFSQTSPSQIAPGLRK